MKHIKKIYTIAVILLPFWASASAFKPTFVVDKPKVCLDKNAMSEMVTFSNTTEEALWTGKITYNWKFINTNTKDSTLKTGFGPYSVELTEGDWVVVLSAVDEKTPEPNRGFSTQDIYIGRKKTIIMPTEVKACIGSSAMLAANNGFEQYIWLKDKDTVGKTQKIMVDGAGNYNLRAISFANCISNDSVKVIREICSSIDDVQAINKFTISPNPATDELHISALMNNKVNLTISISDIMGKEVVNQNMGIANRFEKTIDISNLNKGIYQLHYQLDGQTAKIERIIIK